MQRGLAFIEDGESGGEKLNVSAGLGFRSTRGMRSLHYMVDFCYTIYLIQEDENEESYVCIGAFGRI
jgi:hypothetical protein